MMLQITCRDCGFIKETCKDFAEIISTGLARCLYCQSIDLKIKTIKKESKMKTNFKVYKEKESKNQERNVYFKLVKMFDGINLIAIEDNNEHPILNINDNGDCVLVENINPDLGLNLDSWGFINIMVAK